jgi:hypothetical protein
MWPALDWQRTVTGGTGAEEEYLIVEASGAGCGVEVAMTRFRFFFISFLHIGPRIATAAAGFIEVTGTRKPPMV